MDLETHLPNKGLDATSTTVGLVEGNLTNDLVTELPVIISLDKMSCVRKKYDDERGRHTCGAS